MKKALALLLLMTAPAARGGDIAVKGSLKSYLYTTSPATTSGLPGQPEGTYAASENKLRLKTYWDGGRLKAEAAYELTYISRDAELAAAQPFSGGGDYRVSDARAILSPASGGASAAAVLIQDLDRAFLTWSPPAFDLYAGRQPLAFGSARAVNPTDVLSPYPFGTIDTEERRGADALRLKVPAGEMGEFDAGWLPGPRWEPGASAGFLRAKGPTRLGDVTLLAAGFRGNLLAGGDLERQWGGAMLRAEAAQVWAGRFGERLPEDDYFALSAGAEYNFSLFSGLDTYLEYHYNGAGASGPAGYPDLEERTAYTEASVYLLGRHYLSAGAAAQLTPLVSAGADVMVNLGDRSFYTVPSIEWNAAENLYFSAGALLPSGPGAAMDGFSAVPASEFGLYDRSVYVSLRKYF